MKWLKGILITMVVLILVGVGGFVLYYVAYSEGEAAGYKNGYAGGYSLGEQEGHDEGYISGKQEGYAEGEADGYNLGEAAGYISGKQEGYAEGEVAGYEEGYDEGVEAGLGHGYALRDPTYKEAVTFLRKDRTDRNRYVDDSYVCSHFSRDVGNNAEEEGWRCAFVELRLSEGGHAIIAFNTIDKGLLFFEPQFDNEVSVIVGKSYSRLNDYQEPDYDDTIRDILVIW